MVIRTPDQRVRVFVSSTLDELAPERQAAHAAITRLHLTPVLFESGAHPHPPRDLYRAYLEQSAVFVGVYWQHYGWVAPGMAISGLEDEYRLAGDRPKLIYIKTPAPDREPRLQALLDHVRAEEVACYQRFTTPEELGELLQNDLALLLTEHFEQARRSPAAVDAPPVPLPRRLPTGTVTFLFTDIEGSTRLLQQLGDRYAAVLGEHQQMLRTAFTAHGGVEVDTQGDSFFVAFPTAPAAVAAAAAAQHALADHAWPDGAAVRVRMGLHTGTPLVAGDHYVGLDVHRAARIAAAGHGGQVLLSASTRVLTEHDLPDGATLRDVGLHRLKDLQRPEALSQLVLPGLPADFPPLKTLDRHAHNLPIQPTALLGREDEVAQVCALLRRDAVRLVTLTGPAGVGKTRLGLQVAAELADEFADGVWFVRLSPLTDPALVLPTIAQTLGLLEAGGAPIVTLVHEYVRTRRLLFLLDNFEHVVGAAPHVAELLATSPGVKVMVTSRVVLRLRGEKELPVPSLELPPETTRQPQVERLSQYAAVALFLERVRDARPDFQVTNTTAPAVAAICTRLEGLPLALELAAAKVKVLPPPVLLQRLERQLPVLTGGARDLEERQQTMRATLAWSYDLLQPAAQRLFRRLAVFVGGWTLEAAEAVCAAPEGAAPLGIEVLDGLGELIDQSLVWQRDETNGTARFGMLHVICEYALEQLEASSEAGVFRRAHFAYSLGLAEQGELELFRHDQVAWLARFGREQDNFRVALGWARDRGEVERGLRLAGALFPYWFGTSRFTEGRNWLEALLALTARLGTRGEAVSPATRAKALYAAGAAAVWQGDTERGVPLLEQSVTLARELRSYVAGMALNALGAAALRQGDEERAVAHYEESLAQLRRVGEPAFTAIPLDNLGQIAYLRGDLERASTYLEEALALGQSAGNGGATAHTLLNLAGVARRQGGLARAAALGREALTLMHETGSRYYLTYCLETLANIVGASGQGERAARLLGAAKTLRETDGTLSWPIEQEETAAAVAKARAVLGEEAWAAAFAAGQALTLEEAVAEALGEGGEDADA
jgi:predicted ATPase/class 3 adenylate cyclase